ncbi:acyltransferase family protein [Nocardioides sp. zg-536]|uniref:Acyltransferase family protein n=1 Tax=Nocardioides faecalis TaxID=2803858 RepID=A0A938XZX5_9ACTN|nr:acyltransferase family protein [Nocardioides faecalis]MBM9459316.1 acyltransferase family protein [Nocardioides faecalis]MBS4751555.1 acyltransferase family protein [Nocardioides faecalis]QVI59562.1 acyltransferase family protein [Nocardioides faecalis]
MASRDPWLDNAKAGLVLLVVVGHAWEMLPLDGPAGHLYDFLYLWHMPAFVFLSGYLSRSFAYDSRRMWQLVSTLLVPYLLFEGLLGWFRLQLGDEELQDLWLDPHFPMWYLLALVVWRLATPVLRPLPGAALVAVGLCLASGFLADDWARWLDLPRLLGFLPFFVLGLKTTPETLQRLRGRVPVLLGLAAGAVVAVVAVNLEHWSERAHLYYRTYDAMETSETGSMLVRLVMIGVGLLGTYAWLTLVPRVDGWFTRMGAATMVVYLFHGFAVKWLDYSELMTRLEGRPWLGMVVATAFGAGLALLLGSPPVRRLLGHVVDPFATAQKKVDEAVALTAVVAEAEAGPLHPVPDVARQAAAGR